MKGDLPWYLIAIILAISVLILFAYFLWTRSSSFNLTVLEEECRAKKELYCGLWRVGKKPSEDFAKYAPGCSTYFPINDKICSCDNSCG